MTQDQQTLSHIRKWSLVAHLTRSHALSLSSWHYKKLSIFRLLTENLIVFIFQFIGLILTTTPAQPHIIWLATGAATAFIFMRGSSILPGICLGSFFAFFIASGEITLALSCASILAIQSFSLFILAQGYISPTLIFCRLNLFIRFALLASSLTALTSLFFILVCHNHLTITNNITQLWITWWLANFIAIITFAIAIISWDYYFAELDTFKPSNKRNLMLPFVLILFCTAISGVSRLIPLTLLMAAINITTSFYVGRRLGWRGIVVANFISVMCLVILGLTFTRSIADIILLQLTVIAAALTGYLAAYAPHLTLSYNILRLRKP